MTYRQISIYVLCGCILLFFILLIIQRLHAEQKRQTAEMIMNGIADAHQMTSKSFESLNKYSFFQKKVMKIQAQLDELYDTETTPENILKFKIMVLIGGSSITLLLHLIFNTLFITLIAIFVTVSLFFSYDLVLKSRVQAKRDEFDRILPQYESNLLLGLQAGAGIQNAMEMAIRTIPSGLIQIEFRQLLNERNMYADNEAKPYMNLSKRVPTKDCERFCNIIISGIKNGNSMSEILTQESEYMTQQQLNKIKEKSEKNSTTSTVISTLFIFFPIVLLFLLPIMFS